MERRYASAGNERSQHTDVDSDCDFSSIYGSDVESVTDCESIVGHEPNREPNQALVSPPGCSESPRPPVLAELPLPALCVVRRLPATLYRSIDALG
jgi:hypothetical protein